MMLEGNSTYHGELGLGQADLIETNKNIKRCLYNNKALFFNSKIINK